MEFRKEDHQTLSNIVLKCEYGKWYNIDPNREDFEKIVSSMKRVIDCFGVIEFLDDTFTKFKRVKSFREEFSEFGSRQEINKPSVSLIRNTGGTFSSKTYKHTTEEKKSLKSLIFTSNKKDIPGLCSRPDICERIMKEKSQKEYFKTEQQEKEKQRIEKIKQWKKK